ncbi:acyl-CoA dehydrogenase family protein [Pseudoroseomonas wenyumeiae]
MLRTEGPCSALALADSLAQRFAARARRQGDHGFPHENHRDLHEQGYLRLLLPRDQGGTEAGLVEMVQAQERLARGDAATALITAMAAVVMGRLREERPGRKRSSPRSARPCCARAAASTAASRNRSWAASRAVACRAPAPRPHRAAGWWRGTRSSSPARRRCAGS